MAVLAIVWRNPKRVGIRRRWRQLKSDASCRHYIMEELVSPRTDYWVGTSRLEIVSFPRTTAHHEAKARKWNLGFGA
jgi:hypothetical protein